MLHFQTLSHILQDFCPISLLYMVKLIGTNRGEYCHRVARIILVWRIRVPGGCPFCHRSKITGGRINMAAAISTVEELDNYSFSYKFQGNRGTEFHLIELWKASGDIEKRQRMANGEANGIHYTLFQSC